MGMRLCWDPHAHHRHAIAREFRHQQPPADTRPSQAIWDPNPAQRAGPMAAAWSADPLKCQWIEGGPKNKTPARARRCHVRAGAYCRTPFPRRSPADHSAGCQALGLGLHRPPARACSLAWGRWRLAIWGSPCSIRPAGACRMAAESLRPSTTVCGVGMCWAASCMRGLPRPAMVSVSLSLPESIS